MTEQEKIAHILKGIAEHVFYLLFQKEFSSVEEISTFCRAMDIKFIRRISNTFLLPRLPNTIAFPTYTVPMNGHVEPVFDRVAQSPTLPCAPPAPPATSFTSVPPVIASVVDEEERVTKIVEKV